MSREYKHKSDSIDDVVSAVSRYSQAHGDPAAMRLFPPEIKGQIEELMSIRNCGIVTAVEVLIRLGLFIERKEKENG